MRYDLSRGHPGVGPTGRGNFTSAVDMRNKKYQHWAALAEKHDNIVTIRYEELRENPKKFMAVLRDVGGYDCQAGDKFKPVTDIKSNSQYANRMRGHDEAPEWSWNAEDWGLLRELLDLEQEARLGYTYGVDPPPPVKGGILAPVRKPT